MTETSPGPTAMTTPLNTIGYNTDLQSKLNSQPAASKVFNITELHEAILLQLPVRYLLLAQSASQSWLDTIRNSRAIQVALFLRPAMSAPGRYSMVMYSSNPGALIRATSIAHKSNSLQLSASETPAQILIDLFSTGGQRAWGRNLFLPTILSRHKNDVGRAYQVSIQEINEISGTSWRDMYITQPPVTKVQLIRLPDFMERDHLTDADVQRFRPRFFSQGKWKYRTWIGQEEPKLVENTDGVKILQFLDSLKTEIREDEKLYFTFFTQYNIKPKDESPA